MGGGGRLDVGTDLGDDGGAEGHVGDKVAVHLAGLSMLERGKIFLA